MLDHFGTMPGSGDAVPRVTLQNDALRVQLIGFGAAIQTLGMRDGTGGYTNVVCGLTTLQGYIDESPHFGAVPGRYAGRIANGRFTLDGQDYELSRNDGANSLHGGRNGFGKRPWRLNHHSSTNASFAITSADGDEGFPGMLEASVNYTLADHQLRLDFKAITTRPTVLNLTNHSYFNLAGEGSGSILDHHLMLNSGHYLPITPTSIPTGELRSVSGSPFDFRQPKAIGRDIRLDDLQLRYGLGYDHCYQIIGKSLRQAAVLCHPPTCRSLTVLTTEPYLQCYTGNMLTGRLAGPAGRIYRQTDAICLECQHPSNAPNEPTFPSTVLRPGETFASTTIFRFETAKL